MFTSFKQLFAILLLAFASVQTAQAMDIVYSSMGGVAGTLDSPATFVEMDEFEVIEGMQYIATFSDVFANFNSFSMTVFDTSNPIPAVGSYLSPGSGTALGSFSFTALTSASHKIVLLGETNALSTYAAAITAVPVPATIWFMATGMFALVGFGRRKIV